MTVTTTGIQQSYAGNGSSTTFALPQTPYAGSEVVVIVRDDTTLVETTQVAGTDFNFDTTVLQPSSVIFVTAPASGETVVITVRPMGTQPVDLDNASGLWSTEVEKGLDRLALAVQYLQHQLDRCIKLKETYAAYADPELADDATARATKYLAFDSSGEPIVQSAVDASLITVTAFAETLLDDATAAAMLTTLGVTSFAQTVLDDANAATARTTLGVPTSLATTAGKQSKWIPAEVLTASVTNGAAAAALEYASGVNLSGWDFDTTTQEFMNFTWKPPKSWNEGTLTFIVHWTAASGSGGVAWALEAVAVSNDDALNATFGTAVQVNDTLIATDDEHITAESAALTVGGTPAEGDLVLFRIKRVPADAGDTIANDVTLLGLELFWTKNADTDD